MPEADAVDLDTLLKLAESDSRVDVLWLYGSRAKGTASPDSDYDLAVAFSAIPDDPWERRLQPENLAMDWAVALGVADDHVSVIDINHVPVPLAYSVVTTGRVLFVRDRLRLAREENRITSMWEVDHQYHKRHYG